MKFIEVTEIIFTRDYRQLERKILINVGNIAWIRERNNTGCDIKFIDGENFVTRESYSQIRSALFD
jgi:hypothetical protein